MTSLHIHLQDSVAGGNDEDTLKHTWSGQLHTLETITDLPNRSSVSFHLFSSSAHSATAAPLPPGTLSYEAA